VDFDIAVQGESFAQVQSLLAEALAAYIQDVGRESPKDAQRLLNRRAPFFVRPLH